MPGSGEIAQLLRLAERDRRAFQALKTAEGVDSASACFHAQQSVEKFMKVVLVSRGIVFRRTHDLLELAELLQKSGIALPVAVEQLSRLNPYAVMLRYEDVDVDTLAPNDAQAILDSVSRWAVHLLGAQ